MLKSHVIIGTYNHIPEGAEESFFEETYQVCWRPFLSALYRFPEIYAVVHYTGTVLRWLEARHPEFLMLLEEMAARKQIELLGGGFFAPLLPLVSSQDRLGQIELLTTYIRKAFGKRPRGCWIQDYAWEPSLASTLPTCGFDYGFLPERSFRLAGAALGLPAVTEDQGRSVAVIPVFDAVEAFDSLLPPDAAVEAVRDRHGELPLIAVFYPDRAAKALWESSGLESPDVLFERSFAALRREGLDYETTTANRYMKASRRSGRAYFPGSASELLMRRSLPESAQSAAASNGLLQAGSPRRLLLRYEESMDLYAKMQYVRILVGQLRGDKSRKKTAQEELWRGQCGEAYWYGPTGGLCRLPVRAAAYAALIEAEKATRQRGTFSSGIIAADIDFDGEKEILYQGGDYNAYVHLKGGVLLEFDSMRTRTNYVNVLSESAGEGRPRRSRRCFHDRVFPFGSFEGDSGGFADGLYSLGESERPAHLAVLSREGQADLDGRRRSLSIRKGFSFRKGSLTVEYLISNKEEGPLRFRFGAELNLAAGPDTPRVGLLARRGAEELPLESGAALRIEGATGICLENRDDEEKVEIRSDRPFDFHHKPIFRSVVVDGISRDLYQGASLVLGWDLDIPAGGSVRFSLALELRA
ncbi:MAG: DUF1926 domain-containing protein [Spirochaetaceae bacterium]|nr:DUF1926 domain-containing protein [Spirochaetaceae bacterium]